MSPRGVFGSTYPKQSTWHEYIDAMISSALSQLAHEEAVEAFQAKVAEHIHA